ncbi:MAG: NADH-quinone oxidoreductase subunit L [Nitrospira sp.]|nr:NADH-quinone oxidoreductase subunit L [Nitrospira sp.]
MSLYTLIPLLPLAAFLLLALGGRQWGETSHRVAIPAIWLPFGFSIGALVEVATHGPISVSLYKFMQSGNLVVELGLYIDSLTVLLLLLVTGVSGIVQVYSARYMIGDPHYSRFFALMALFTFSMIMLVMSRNLLLLYIVWEIMGLCSYLLIAHWAERRATCRAATQAFLMNAVADVGLGFGVILTFITFGTLEIPDILARAGEMSGQTINLLGWAGLNWPVQTVTLIALGVFVGAVGKSAQLPFHIWLPSAMEAPTPISALIHAATMVNAGPFLLVRLSPLVMLSPVAMTVIAVIGGVTALYAGVVSLTQTDIKKILAYSTMSQLGFMIMACGLGAFAAAIFHLLAHGCLKGFLFLSTGNTLYTARAHEPQTLPLPLGEGRGEGSPPRSLIVGALTLACIPPCVIFAGPYEQLWTVQPVASAYLAFWVVGLSTVFVTAMAVVRGVLMFFQHGPTVESPAGAPVHVHPRVFSPSHLLLVVSGVVVASGLLMLVWTWFGQFLAPALAPPGATLAATDAATPTAISWGLSVWILVPLGVAVCGWGVAYARHLNPGWGSPGQSEWGRRLYVFFLNKAYFEVIYDMYIVEPVLQATRWLWQTVDRGGIDRSITCVGGAFIVAGQWLARVVDVRNLDRVPGGAEGPAIGRGRWLRRGLELCGFGTLVAPDPQMTEDTARMVRAISPQTIQHHVLVMIFWLIIAVGLFYWFAP